MDHTLMDGMLVLLLGGLIIVLGRPLHNIPYFILLHLLLYGWWY